MTCSNVPFALRCLSVIILMVEMADLKGKNDFNWRFREQFAVSLK